MIKNYKDKNENVRDYNSELLLKILNKTSIEAKNNNDLTLDELHNFDHQILTGRTELMEKIEVLQVLLLVLFFLKHH